ncbi:hypothetical protein Y1Q_0023944 [Alligator mississippiensis]|uniref:Inositol-tetrakisphosphate 1-kinase n=1 Tax=Alligator mississippiensis TaxID=8496 RepID=A0A151PIU6_ALLMI|nr:hypothetical protein Y1Q_0023944 [Alligator mississippiensis]
MPGRGRGWRIGYCLPEQKKRKLNFQDFEALCRERGHEVVEGPFDVILHKPSDLLLASDYDIHAQSLVDNFQTYTDTHARTLVLDPLSSVRPLLDRFESCLLLRDLRAQDNSVFSPPCVELPAGSGREALGQVLTRGLTFPLICKTRVAHGPDSHQMTLVFNEEGLGDVRGPCLLQSFVNHDAALFKVFVVGDAHFVVRRPSLKNFPRGQSARGSIFFDSREVSKPESCSRLTELEQAGPGPTPPAPSVVGRTVRGLRNALGLSLFGVDLIVERQTGRCAAIDLNAFPGYEGVPEFFPALLSHIETLLETREREEPPSSPPETP